MSCWSKWHRVIRPGYFRGDGQVEKDVLKLGSYSQTNAERHSEETTLLHLTRGVQRRVDRAGGIPQQWGNESFGQNGRDRQSHE